MKILSFGLTLGILMAAVRANASEIVSHRSFFGKRAPASLYDNRANLPEDVKQAIAVARKHFQTTGSLEDCTESHDFGGDLAVIMEGIPYRVRHMVAVPYPNGGIKVCYSLEK